MGLLLGKVVDGGYEPSVLYKLLRPKITGNSINGVGETEFRRPTPIYHWFGKLKVPFNRASLILIGRSALDRTATRHINKSRHYENKPQDPVASERIEQTPSAWTAEIKKFALSNGADLVGVRRMNPDWVFEGFDIPEQWIIMLGFAMDYDELNKLPDIDGGNEVLRVYAHGQEVSWNVANRLRNAGWPARGYCGPMSSPISMLPAALAAGFGELGKHGSIINRSLGSNLRLAYVLTDIPLQEDTPDAFGADDFCIRCQVCTRECPADAIEPEKKMVRGIRQMRTLFQRHRRLRYLSGCVPLEPTRCSRESGSETRTARRAQKRRGVISTQPGWTAMTATNKQLGAINNSWYVAAHSHELQADPVARTILGTSIVLYRKPDGTPVALRNSCGHRLAPLALGKVVAEGLQCGYHGAIFDEHGRCVSFAGEQQIPASCSVASYPVTERYGFVWLWPGDSSQARGASIPDLFRRIEDTGWRSADGQLLSFQSHYTLIVDNLFDSTHAKFVHPTTLGAPGLLAQRGEDDGHTTFHADVGERRINYVVDIRNGEAGQCFHEGIGRRLDTGIYAEPIDWYLEVSWHAPSFFVFDVTTKPAGEDIRLEARFCTFHAMTPETPISCNYFFKTVERIDAGQESMCDFWHQATSTAFDEDKRMLEAQQAMIGERKPFDNDAWGMFQGDSLGMAARGILKALESAES